ncbi:MAG: thioesterase [Chloroflexi bacterium]|nr:thioesterase [Chloroflexota bacterium]
MANNIPKSNSWFVLSRQATSARLRLFCFPYSGSNAALFHAWQDGLPSSIQVYPVQLPGHGTRIAESPFTQLAPLVQATANALLPYLDKPFALFGHSLGALLTFELARYLRRTHHITPVCLIVSGHGAPYIPDRNLPIHDLPDAEFIAKLRALKGTPSQVLDNPELLEIILPVLRADFAMCETYRYEPVAPLECPIAAFGGLSDAYVSHVELEGWREQTTAPFAIRMFPGDHFFINTARASVLRMVAQELDLALKHNEAEKKVYASGYSMANTAEHIVP